MLLRALRACRALAPCVALLMLHSASMAQSWPSGGGNIQNTRASTDTIIKVSNAKSLQLKWAFTANGDVSATPTVDGNAVYIVDWAGKLYRVNANTGAQEWAHDIAYYTGNYFGSVSRTSPAIYGDTVIVADQGDFNPNDYTTGFFPHSWFGGPDPTGRTASVFAADKATGAPVWRTVVDDHGWSMITSSPVVYNGVAYVGVCSFEETRALFGPWYQETFRGSVVALNASTGALLWRTYLAPTGYAGCAVMGRNPRG